MTRLLPPASLAPVLLVMVAPALSGCVAGLAVGAAGAAARGVAGKPQNNEHAHGSAEAECSNRAAQYGQVHIIDVEQRSPSKIVVWGTADDGKVRRSFECSYGTKVTGFKLRTIGSRR